jgi:hypothetical protein
MAKLAVSKCDLAWFCTGRRMLSLFGHSLLCGLGNLRWEPAALQAVFGKLLGTPAIVTARRTLIRRVLYRLCIARFAISYRPIIDD